MKYLKDLKNDWPKIKKQLLDVSQQAMELVKKGEEEVVKLTKKGKLQVDLASCSLKREQLYYQIGKEFVKAKYPGSHTEKMNTLISELTAVEKEEKALHKRIKAEKQ